MEDNNVVATATESSAPAAPAKKSYKRVSKKKMLEKNYPYLKSQYLGCWAL